MSNSSSRYWLLLGVAALAIAGIFALPLVAGRESSSPLVDALFHKALVVHVDLSVLVWFLCIACLMWSLLAAPSRQTFPYIEEAALVAMGLGLLAMALSPLDSQAQALMSNYIPVISSPIFFLGLGLLLCSVVLMLVRVASGKWQVNKEDLILSTCRLPLATTIPIAFISIFAFIWSYVQTPHGMDPQEYYDTLFWGGGHVLQFVHVQMAMVIWLMLARALDSNFYVYKPHLYILFSIGLVSSLSVPWAYLHYPPDDPTQRQFFTYLMVLANGIAPTVLALWIAPGLISLRHRFLHSDRRALYAALCTSFVLFIYGNVLGALIEGQNVVIPAHYHGAIVGVTLAFMGLAYLLLPQFGYRDTSNWRLAFWQPIVYGGGQFLHISGLAWSGGYGVLRKTPGGLEHMPWDVRAAMGLMGIGGLLAIIGGFIFVIVIARSVMNHFPA